MPISVRVTTPIIDPDDPRFMNALRHASEDIAAALRRRVEERTPNPDGPITGDYTTGALRDSITAQAYTSDVTGKRESSLVLLYADDGPQEDTWGRVYAPYQEGPPLGLSTYTRGEWRMFDRVQEEDTDLIEAWTEAALGDIPDWESEDTTFGDA